MSEIDDLKRDVQKLESEVAVKKQKINSIISRCQHQWGPEINDPIIEKAYTIEGDPPGWGGADHRFETYVPEKRTPRWSRTCKICGLQQYTFNTTVTQTVKPKF